MVLHVKSKIRKMGDSIYVHLPRDLRSDSQFPLKDVEDVEIKVEGKVLIISKL